MEYSEFYCFVLNQKKTDNLRSRKLSVFYKKRLSCFMTTSFDCIFLYIFYSVQIDEFPDLSFYLE